MKIFFEHHWQLVIDPVNVDSEGGVMRNQLLTSNNLNGSHSGSTELLH